MNEFIFKELYDSLDSLMIKNETLGNCLNKGLRTVRLWTKKI